MDEETEAQRGQMDLLKAKQLESGKAQGYNLWFILT